MRSLVVAALALATAAAGFFWLSPSASEQELHGLWSRVPLREGPDDAPMAFYYFHNDDNIGLYRYGKTAYNTTNSYHWSIDSGVVDLAYNKTGERVRIPYRIEKGSRPVLILAGDPRTPGQAETRYTYVPPMQQREVAPDLFDRNDAPTSTDSLSSDRVDNRLWIDLKSFKTGGIGFSLYQLRAAGIDGRGTGWHHVGDFDDWSTESFGYRIVRRADELGADAAGRGLDLLFTLRNERATTALQMEHRTVDGKDVRFLTMGTDPRDFWAPHVYADAGPSFAGFAALALHADSIEAVEAAVHSSER